MSTDNLTNIKNFDYGIEKIFDKAQDFLPIDGTDYVELYVGNAKQAADFTTAHNYSIDPEINKIKKAKFSLSQLPGLLDKYDIVINKAF